MFRSRGPGREGLIWAWSVAHWILVLYFFFRSVSLRFEWAKSLAIIFYYPKSRGLGGARRRLLASVGGVGSWPGVAIKIINWLLCGRSRWNFACFSACPIAPLSLTRIWDLQCNFSHAFACLISHINYLRYLHLFCGYTYIYTHTHKRKAHFRWQRPFCFYHLLFWRIISFCGFSFAIRPQTQFLLWLWFTFHNYILISNVSCFRWKLESCLRNRIYCLLCGWNKFGPCQLSIWKY